MWLLSMPEVVVIQVLRDIFVAPEPGIIANTEKLQKEFEKDLSHKLEFENQRKVTSIDLV